MTNATPLQLCRTGATIYDTDSTLPRNEIEGILLNALGPNAEAFDFKRSQRVGTVCYHAQDKDYYLIIANITSMGGREGQHPADLKRIQYNVMWREFYETFSTRGEVLWCGLYSYNGLNIIGIFEPETYLEKHAGTDMTSKGGYKAQYSCHIFLNDLFQGYSDGVFSKTDRRGNNIGAVGIDHLKSFLDGVAHRNPILDVFDEINRNCIEWNTWIPASQAIPYMFDLKEKTGFANWKQNLWNGWIIEAMYSDYLHDNPSPFVSYIATDPRPIIHDEYSRFALDLAFPDGNKFIGDLKAVSGSQGNTMLNDETHVRDALSTFGRIWFAFYLQETKPGSTNDYEMVKWRNHYIRDKGEWTRDEFNEMSAPRTPHSVMNKQMVIAELNDVTKERYFSVGAQPGLNSDGNVRNYKFKINKNLLYTLTGQDGLIVYRFEA